MQMHIGGQQVQGYDATKFCR